MFFKRLFASALAVSVASTLVTSSVQSANASAAAILYTLKLSNGRTAVVFRDGRTEIFSKDHRRVQFGKVAMPSALHDVVPNGTLPDAKDLAAELERPVYRHPFVDGRVIVVFKDGSAPAQDLVTVNKTMLSSIRKVTPAYTSDGVTNRVLASIGTDRLERLFRATNRSQLGVMRSNAQADTGRTLLNIANAYRLHLTGASVRSAVAQLSKLPSIAYVSPDWRVTTQQTPPIQIPQEMVQHARINAPRMRWRSSTLSFTGRMSYVPSNYALSASLQSLHNAPSVDSAAAFDEIMTKYHQLPGEGEIITNVSLGDLDDTTALNNAYDPCYGYVVGYGPTTHIIGGQRYIDWPSMPLIPTYTADDSGNLNGTGEVCGVDPSNGEIGLDFSMMAPLPTEHQRPGQTGSGFTDLLGIAPGANYRLVVPASSSGSLSDIQGALLAASLQTPRPNIITASLGFGFDSIGFAGRFLDDDPLTEALVSSIVNGFNIVVCLSANDGIRTYTYVATGPSGGSTATNTATPGGDITNLNDIGYSGYPSFDYDSGAIDVGGSTLDDIFSAPPQFARNEIVQAQHAYPETRFSGFASFSSGYGTRVNVSAPADNVIAFAHAVGNPNYDAVGIYLEGGTSASAPEVAAVAAVVQQVARLTGRPFKTATAIRRFLEETANAIPPNGQADQNLHVGPQVDLLRAIETLQAEAGQRDKPAVPRVAVEQRRNVGLFDGAFLSDTDPTNIDLSNNDNANLASWITIAPDWEWMPPAVKYRLTVAGSPARVLATTPWARLLPSTIFAEVGQPLASSSLRTVKLQYDAYRGNVVLASIPVTLTFSASGSTSAAALAPSAPLVETGNTIPVTYDLSHVDGVSSPKLIVSYPGRFDPAFSTPMFQPMKTFDLRALSGTVNVPVSSLLGGGIYGIGIEFNSSTGAATDFTYIRVQPSSAAVTRPLPPLLSSNDTQPGHFLEVPYGGTFKVSYDVRNVPYATGAEIEIAAPGPTLYGFINAFSNPNGSIVDKDGIDTASVYLAPLPGRAGTITLNAKAIGLTSTFYHTVRVIPMQGSVAAGEASDVSTITEDGVVPADGGYVNNGFAINANSTDAYLTSAQYTASNEFITSLETFSTTTNQVTAKDASASNGQFFGLGSAFDADLGLIAYQDGTTFANSYNILNPIASGVLGPAWTPPGPSTLDLLDGEAAFNQSTTTAAIFGQDLGLPYNDNWRLFTTNLKSGANGPVYDITGPIQSQLLPEYANMAENATTNYAWLTSLDGFLLCGTAPTIVGVNLANGSAAGFTGDGNGVPLGIALDSKSNKMAVTTSCDSGVTIYDLASKTGHEIALPGVGNGYYTANDPIHGLFVIAQPWPNDVATNNNALSNMLVYDENGNLVKSESGFNWLGQYLQINQLDVQLIPSKRMGYTFSAGQTQLEPFTY
jgi:hypothetical protein